MRKACWPVFFAVCSFFPWIACGEEATELDLALRSTREACTGISEELKPLRIKAGVNTALTAVGTASGAVALGTGIAKAQTDKKIDEIEAELQEEINRLEELAETQTDFDFIPVDAMRAALAKEKAEGQAQNGKTVMDEKREELERLEKKSKTLGNIRTGTIAGTAATDLAGTIIAATNRVKTELQEQVFACAESVKKLSKVAIQAKLNGSATESQARKAQNIVDACRGWELVDLSKINKRATGAAISSGAGAAIAIAGTATSAVANTDKVRADNTDDGKKKEKNLNTASNVLAGGATAASVVATVFNATQIAAIKQAANVADKCDGELK